MSPIYTFKRTQLLARLQITPAESAHLDVLIDDAEHRARERKRKADARRARGCRTNAERGAARAAEADREAIKVEALRAQGRTWSQVADALGITEGSAQQRLRRLRKRRAERGDASAAGTPA
jgi:transcriptional regulator with PAS, ATPase and Fis domain